MPLSSACGGDPPLGRESRRHGRPISQLSDSGVFTPVSIDGEMLIDGSVVANLPVRQALESGANRVFVLPARVGGGVAPPTSALDMMAALDDDRNGRIGAQGAT
jgi:hypothetical protein